MRRVVAGLALALVLAAPVSAAGSIAVNEAAPYSVGEYVTLTVDVPKLKGYEYPVVLIWCGYLTEPGYEGVKNWVYFRRWDTKGYDYPRSTGPEAILLMNAMTGAPCVFELWAYGGLKGPAASEHVLAVGPTITVNP